MSLDRLPCLRHHFRASYEGMSSFNSQPTFRVLAADGRMVDSHVPATVAGHSRLRIFGRLDCSSARYHLSKGRYRKYRVFFQSLECAIVLGYRPCGRCLPDAYRAWRRDRTESERHPAAKWIATAAAELESECPSLVRSLAALRETATSPLVSHRDPPDAHISTSVGLRSS